MVLERPPPTTGARKPGSDGLAGALYDKWLSPVRHLSVSPEPFFIQGQRVRLF